jgi:hypothetical protein
VVEMVSDRARALSVRRPRIDKDVKA